MTTLTDKAAEAIAAANAFYRDTYGVADRFDAAEVVARFTTRGYLTLAELRALEEAGLAFGYHVKAATGRPGLTPLGKAAAKVAETKP